MEPVFDVSYPAIRRAAPVTRAQVAALKNQVQQAWLHGKEYRLQTGKLLEDLRDALSVKGHGTFGATLVELGIKRSTARDYINLYRESRGLQPRRSPRKRGNRAYAVLHLHGLKDVAGEFFRRRPEDIAAFWQRLADNHPLPSEK